MEVDLLWFITLQEVSTAKVTEVVIKLVAVEFVVLTVFDLVILENEAKYAIFLLFYVQIGRKRENGTQILGVDFFNRICVVRVLVETHVAIIA